MCISKTATTLSAFVAAAIVVGQSSPAADIRGKIATVSSGAAGGSVLIEGAQEKDTNVDKAATRITAKTLIFKMQEGRKVPKKFSDLKVGQLVEATFAGPVLESYPVQAIAGEIIVLAETAIPQNESVFKEGAEVAVDGTLEGGIMAIGGESTGWVLKYQTRAGPQQIEVDCSALEVQEIPEGAVHIAGKVFKKNYVERGPTLILKATRIRARRGASTKRF